MTHVFNKIGWVLDSVMMASNHRVVENIIRSSHCLPVIDRSVTTSARSMIAFCSCAPYTRCNKHRLFSTRDDLHFFLSPLCCFFILAVPSLERKFNFVLHYISDMYWTCIQSTNETRLFWPLRTNGSSQRITNNAILHCYALSNYWLDLRIGLYP
jgi:hypothetical protein